MPHRDIIVIGGSFGSVNALVRLVGGLPAAFPASVFIVCHFPADCHSVLPQILSRSGSLLAAHPTDGATFYPGQIYVAPPDYHLLLGPESRIRLTRDARENRHRPAIDPLFRSAARYYGQRVIGMILSGGMQDGAAGLLAVRSSGGIAVVQDPQDADMADMPRSAAQIAGADYSVPLAGMARLLVELVHSREERSKGGADVDPVEQMPDVVDRHMHEQARGERLGNVSVYTCPECGGALWQVDDAQPLRFRCHVGHMYNGEVLLGEQTEALEAALWTAVRTFREKSVLARQLATCERRADQTDSADRFDEQAEQAERHGALIHSLLLKGVASGAPDDSPSAGDAATNIRGAAHDHAPPH
jgi:two-component system chemotaxis response regulator CheB